MSFVCISPASIVHEDPLSEAESRPQGVEDVQTELNKVDFGGDDKLVLCLPGGGIVAPGIGRNPEMAVVGPFVAVLSGSLQNYAYLVRKYCLEDLSLPSTISLEAIRERTPIREAALVCKLYERLGTGMLTKLRGKFAFSLFDSSTLRVLAARDPSGEVDLVQGEMEEGFVFLASGATRPPGAKAVREIEAGQFIYGWASSPKKYANPLDEVEKTATQAVGAASEALKGIKLKPDLGGKGARRSLDSLRKQHPKDAGAPPPGQGRRRSAETKRDVTTHEEDGWRVKGGRKNSGSGARRGARRASADVDRTGGNRRRSADAAAPPRGKPAEAHAKPGGGPGKQDDRKQHRPNSPHKAGSGGKGHGKPRRASSDGGSKAAATKGGARDRKNVAAAAQGAGVPDPVHVAPVH